MTGVSNRTQKVSDGGKGRVWRRWNSDPEVTRRTLRLNPAVFQLRAHLVSGLMKLKFLMSCSRKNSVRDKVIDKKGIYLERNTLHSVSHLRRREGHRVWVCQALWAGDGGWIFHRLMSERSIPTILARSRDFQARLQQYMNREFPDVQTGFRKDRGTEIKLPTPTGSSEKLESSRKTSISALLTMLKLLTMWITTNCGKFWKRWEYQTTWPASWEICMQVREQ